MSEDDLNDHDCQGGQIGAWGAGSGNEGPVLSEPEREGDREQAAQRVKTWKKVQQLPLPSFLDLGIFSKVSEVFYRNI